VNDMDEKKSPPHKMPHTTHTITCDQVVLLSQKLNNCQEDGDEEGCKNHALVDLVISRHHDVQEKGERLKTRAAI